MPTGDKEPWSLSSFPLIKQTHLKKVFLSLISGLSWHISWLLPRNQDRTEN